MQPGSERRAASAANGIIFVLASRNRRGRHRGTCLHFVVAGGKIIALSATVKMMNAPENAEN